MPYPTCVIKTCKNTAVFTELVVVDGKRYNIDTCPVHGAPTSEPEINRDWMLNQLLEGNVDLTKNAHRNGFGLT